MAERLEASIMPGAIRTFTVAPSPFADKFHHASAVSLRFWACYRLSISPPDCVLVAGRPCRWAQAGCVGFLDADALHILVSCNYGGERTRRHNEVLRVISAYHSVFELLALSLTPFNKEIKSTPLGLVSDA